LLVLGNFFAFFLTTNRTGRSDEVLSTISDLEVGVTFAIAGDDSKKRASIICWFLVFFNAAIAGRNFAVVQWGLFFWVSRSLSGELGFSD
jgi:hypothetical protein